MAIIDLSQPAFNLFFFSKLFSVHFLAFFSIKDDKWKVNTLHFFSQNLNYIVKNCISRFPTYHLTDGKKFIR